MVATEAMKASIQVGDVDGSLPSIQIEKSLPRRKTLWPLPLGATTLVVRNVPGRYTKEMLLEEWPAEPLLNLLHLPINKQEQRRSGYAFVNFVSPEAALHFQAKVHGSYPLRSPGKYFDVRSAKVQGFEATLMQITIERLSYAELPAVFFGKERLPPKWVRAQLELVHKYRARTCHTSGKQGHPPCVEAHLLNPAPAVQRNSQSFKTLPISQRNLLDREMDDMAQSISSSFSSSSSPATPFAAQWLLRL